MHFWSAHINIFLIEGPRVGFNPVVYTAEEEMGDDLVVCIEMFNSGNPNPIEIFVNTTSASATGRIWLHVYTKNWDKCLFFPAFEDYEALSDQLLTFPAQSMMGDTACTNIAILDDNIPENAEMFFANIRSDDADIEAGRSQASITIEDTGDTGIFIVVF